MEQKQVGPGSTSQTNFLQTKQPGRVTPSHVDRLTQRNSSATHGFYNAATGLRAGSSQELPLAGHDNAAIFENLHPHGTFYVDPRRATSQPSSVTGENDVPQRFTPNDGSQHRSGQVVPIGNDA